MDVGYCKFYETRNRSPLLISFDFGRFIYKNDDQLAHEIIAMSLVKYLNLAIKNSNATAVEYDIIP